MTIMGLAEQRCVRGGAHDVMSGESSEAKRVSRWRSMKMVAALSKATDPRQQGHRSTSASAVHTAGAALRWLLCHMVIVAGHSNKLLPEECLPGAAASSGPAACARACADAAGHAQGCWRCTLHTHLRGLPEGEAL